MNVNKTTTVLSVADHEPGVAWYGQILGRGPDRRPMDGCAEWDLTDSSAVQVYRNATLAGTGQVIVGVDDVDASAASLRAGGIDVEPFTVESGQFRLAVIHDPAGNTVTFGQTLTS